MNPTNYMPEHYLPENLVEWRLRIRELIDELRNPNLLPGRGHLYAQAKDGRLLACIEGVVNEMASRNSVPAQWVNMEIDGPDSEPLTIWEIMPPCHQNYDTVESSNRALPEALLYHGFDMPEGNLVVDALDCSPAFIREVINEKYGIAFGDDSAAVLNDKLQRQDVNPLHVMADILEHVAEKPHSCIWHGRINHLADRTPANQRI